MTAPRMIEVVLAGALFAAPPVPGDYFRSRSGRSVLAVAKVRRMLGDRAGLRYRLFAMRVRLCDLPPLVTPLPWPRKAAPLPPPSIEAFIGPPLPPPAIIAPAIARIAERKRVVTLLRDDRDDQRPVPKIRTQNQTATIAEWVDPDDLNPRHREAKRISGYRNRDSVQTLLDSGTIGNVHARAARRFRLDYELGEVGLKAARDLAEAPTGYASGTGPSESRLAHLQTYQAISRALTPHLLEVVLAIVIRDETLLSYAQRKRMNRQAVSGYILACLDSLKAIYGERDKEDSKNKKETIGPGLGPNQGAGTAFRRG